MRRDPRSKRRGQVNTTQTAHARILSRAGRSYRLPHHGAERWNVYALRSYLGIVPNDLAASFKGGTVARDVVLGGFFSSLSIEPTIHDVTDRMREIADHALAQFGASDLAGRDVRTLSSGEARRVTIARTLMRWPRVLVFDEPCTLLDLVAQREVRAAMRTTARATASASC